MKRIMETVSKKAKRGRPRGHVRDIAERGGRFVAGPGHCDRTYMNAAYRLIGLGVVRDSDKTAQRAIWGCTGDEVLAGTKNFPRGWQTAAEAIGRWIDAGGDQDEAAHILIDARKRDVSFKNIAAHFRNLRIGEQQGNVLSLLMALSRTLDNYQRRFPRTTAQQRKAAIHGLLEIVEDEGDEEGAGEIDAQSQGGASDD